MSEIHSTEGNALDTGRADMVCDDHAMLFRPPIPPARHRMDALPSPAA